MTLKENAGTVPAAPNRSKNYPNDIMCFKGVKAIGARVIDPELIERLDPLEAIICQKFISDGKWVLKAE